MVTPNTRFDYTPFGGPVSWIAGVVVAGDDESEFRPFGSSFLVAPNLAFTARHVIDAIFEDFAGKRPDDITGQMPFGVQLGTADVSSGKLLKWDVVDYHYSRTIDITGLAIEPAEGLPIHHVWHLPRLNLLPPTEGETITAYGYPNTKSRPLGDGSFRLLLNPKTAAGVVKEVHHQYRDRGSLPFPCFHTNARFDAGMSGGPVFNQAGQIIAVICSNLPPETKDEEHASYASLIWPALGLRFNERSGDVSGARPMFLRSEAEVGRMQVFNLDAMTVVAGTDADRLRFRSPVRRPG